MNAVTTNAYQSDRHPLVSKKFFALLGILVTLTLLLVTGFITGEMYTDTVVSILPFYFGLDAVQNIGVGYVRNTTIHRGSGSIPRRERNYDQQPPVEVYETGDALLSQEDRTKAPVEPVPSTVQAPDLEIINTDAHDSKLNRTTRPIKANGPKGKVNVKDILAKYR